MSTTTEKLARGQAYVICPICDAAGLVDVEAVATVGQDRNERGRYSVLDGFSCENGHNWSDLSPAQARAVLDTACGDLDARDAAAESLYFDSKYDTMKEDGDL